MSFFIKTVLITNSDAEKPALPSAELSISTDVSAKADWLDSLVTRTSVFASIIRGVCNRRSLHMNTTAQVQKNVLPEEMKRTEIIEMYGFVS